MIKKCKGNFPSPILNPCKGRQKTGEDTPTSTSLTSDDNSDNSNSQTGNYGFILVKDKKKQPLPSARIRTNGRDHRGIHPKNRKKDEDVEESFMEFLAAAFCGACISTDGGKHRASSSIEADNRASAYTEDPPRQPTNIYIQRFQKMKLQQKLELEQQKKDTSILTDVSFLTDRTQVSIEVNDEILKKDEKDTLPSRSSHKPKILPAFRKLHNRAANAIASRDFKRKQRGREEEEQPPHDGIGFQDPGMSMLSSIRPPPPPPPTEEEEKPSKRNRMASPYPMEHSRAGSPGWMTKVGSSFSKKKAKKKQQKRKSPFGKKKRIPLDPNARPVRMFVV